MALKLKLPGDFDDTSSSRLHESSVRMVEPVDALAVVVEDICRSLLQYEELRYTRLQLDVPAGTQGQPAQVRWRQCR